MVNNLTDSRDDMYYIDYRDDANLTRVQESNNINPTEVINKESLIKTIEESRNEFSKRN